LPSLPARNVQSIPASKSNECTRKLHYRCPDDRLPRSSTSDYECGCQCHYSPVTR
jgi:hypothetical protein